MKLVRNSSHVGKYSIIDNRTGEVQHGLSGTEDEFFVLKLKDNILVSRCWRTRNPSVHPIRTSHTMFGFYLIGAVS